MTHQPRVLRAPACPTSRRARIAGSSGSFSASLQGRHSLKRPGRRCPALGSSAVDARDDRLHSAPAGTRTGRRDLVGRGGQQPLRQPVDHSAAITPVARYPETRRRSGPPDASRRVGAPGRRRLVDPFSGRRNRCGPPRPRAGRRPPGPPAAVRTPGVRGALVARVRWSQDVSVHSRRQRHTRHNRRREARGSAESVPVRNLCVFARRPPRPRRMRHRRRNRPPHRGRLGVFGVQQRVRSISEV